MDYNPEIEEELSEEEKEAKRVEQELLESLARSIDAKFRKRARARRPKEQQWLRAAKLYYGKLAFEGNFISA